MTPDMDRVLTIERLIAVLRWWSMTARIDSHSREGPNHPPVERGRKKAAESPTSLESESVASLAIRPRAPEWRAVGNRLLLDSERRRLRRPRRIDSALETQNDQV